MANAIKPNTHYELLRKHGVQSTEWIELGADEAVLDGRFTAAQLTGIVACMAELKQPVNEDAKQDTEKKLTEGWGGPACSNKYHYFRGGLSLCRKVALFTGPLDADDGGKRSEDCAACRNALDRDAKRAANKHAPSSPPEQP